MLNPVLRFLENTVKQQYFSFLYFPVMLKCVTYVRDLKKTDRRNSPSLQYGEDFQIHAIKVTHEC